MSSITFLTSVVAARVLSEHSYGAYGFGFSMVVLAQNVQHAVLGESQEVLVSTLEGERRRRMVGTMAMVQIALTVLAVLCFSIPALALDGIVPKALLGAAIASAAIMPSDFVRRMLLADLRVELTTLLSFARFGAHFGVLLTAFLYDSVTLLLFYAAFAVGAAAVAGLGARSAFAGIRGHFRVDRSALAALYDFARWIVLKNVSRYALLNLAYWTLLIVTGLEAGARYTASWLVVAVMNILATGLSSFLTPYFSRLYENQRGVYGTRAMQALLVWTGGFLSMAVLVAIYSEALLELFYGGKYSDTLHVVRLWVVGSALTMIVIFCEIVLKSTRRPQEIWRLQLWSAIPVVPFIYPAVLYGGVVGALWCGVAQRLTMLLFVGGRVFTLLRSGVLAPPSSEPQPPGAGENR